MIREGSDHGWLVLFCVLAMALAIGVMIVFARVGQQCNDVHGTIKGNIIGAPTCVVPTPTETDTRE